MVVYFTPFKTLFLHFIEVGSLFSFLLFFFPRRVSFRICLSKKQSISALIDCGAHSFICIRLSSQYFTNFDSAKMTTKVLIIGFNETEETELVVTLDILRRAELDVTLANLDDEEYFTCVQKTTLKANKFFKDVENETFDAVVIPGGPGSKKIDKVC